MNSPWSFRLNTEFLDLEKLLYVDWDGCPPLQGKDIVQEVRQRID